MKKIIADLFNIIFRNKSKRRILEKKLAYESKVVREESMSVLHEFENLQ